MTCAQNTLMGNVYSENKILYHSFGESPCMFVLTLAARAIKPSSTDTDEMTSAILHTAAAVKTWATSTAVVCNA